MNTNVGERSQEVREHDRRAVGYPQIEGRRSAQPTTVPTAIHAVSAR